MEIICIKAMDNYTFDKFIKKIKRVDAQIFVLTHKKADVKDNLLFTPILGGAAASHIFDYDLRDDLGENISYLNSLYCENTSTYWIFKHMNDPRLKYIGQCAYRRMFDIDEYTDFDKIFKDYDIILPKALVCGDGTIIDNYKEWHSLSDLEDMFGLIEEKYPDYKEDIVKFREQTTLYNGNAFIMKREDYIAYCEFLFPLASEWLIRHNISNLADVDKYVSKKFRNGEYQKFDIEEEAIYYQKRIIGFLSERLLNVFILHNFKNIFIAPVTLTETNY